MEIVSEVNRHEPGQMIKVLAYTDHRRVPFAPGDFGRAVEELWTIVPDARYTINAVHALDAHGSVANLVIEGTDAHGNELQWARTILLVSDEPMTPEGVKTSQSDKDVDSKHVVSHLRIGLDSLKQLINKGLTVKHLKF